MHQSSHPGQQATVVQASLEINKEDDEHEKEANHVAAKVMKMPREEENKKKMSESGGIVQMMSAGPEVKKMTLRDEGKAVTMTGKPAVNRKIQRDSHIPNEGVPGTRGSLDYLPERVDLVNTLNTSAPTPAGRKQFITDFLNTFYNYYLKLLATGNWDKVKSIATKAADPVFTAEQQTPDMNDGGKKKSHWTDLGKRTSMGTAEANAISVIEARPLDNADKLLYPALQTITKGDQAAYDSSLDTAAQTAETTADLIIQMRSVSNVVSRLYAALTVSETTGMDFGRVTALYGQEGNFDMPSSAGSLSKNIPTGESAGVTSLNDENGNKMDFKGMIFTIPTSSGFMTSRPTTQDRKLFALAQYCNQIGGLDVVNMKISEGVTGLAKWSMENRDKLNAQGGLSKILQADTLAGMKTHWQKLIDNIQETTETFKTSIPDPNPSIPKDIAYRFAPVDPMFMVQSILTEAALEQKKYDYQAEDLMGEGNTFSPGVSYMMFNSGANRENDRDKRIFCSGLISAKKLSDAKIKVITGKAASDVTLADLQAMNPDMTEKMIYLLLEVVTLSAGIINKEPSESLFDTSVKPWMQGASRVAPFSRFDLTQYYLEHAGSDEWSSWASTRRNASNFRTLMEFNQHVFR